MTDEHRPQRVVVFNASEDTVDLLTLFFEMQGLEASGEPWPAREALSLAIVQDFVIRHRPDVIVFDVSFPYDHNWARFCEFRRADVVREIPIVLTTTNRHALEEIVGMTEAMEVIGKPYDLDELANRVRNLLSNVSLKKD
jgi:DNA-binding response OmpR family regulator